jgi:hypothetical protein
LVLFAALSLWAGGPNKAEIEAARNAFPNADAIFLDKSEHLMIDIVNGELKLSSKVEERIYFVTERAELYRKYSIYHSFFSDVKDVDASVMANVDGKYKEIKVDNFTTQDNVDANVFYDDLKEVNFTFPAVTPGAIAHLGYTETLKDPHFIVPFYFVSYMPIMNAEYSVTCPSSVRLNYKVFNNDSGLVVFSKEEKGKNVTYHWRAKNVRDIKHEGDAPGFAYYAPHILLTVSEYEKDGAKQKVIPDLQAMCEWYSTFVKNINKDDDSLLAVTVKAITKNAKTDEEKIRNIYYWVEDNITYVAFEDGMNGFIPREAKDICQKRYGDCKDMSSILVKMLRLAGINAYHTWIGSRRLPYKYSEIASANIDDHMICVADAGGKRYVLDGTGKYTPLGFVTGFIQGKEGFILKSDGQCEVYQMPVMPKEKSIQTDTIVVDLKDKSTISGTISESLTGYYRISQAYSYHYTQPEKRVEKFENYLKFGNNKCKISGVNFDGFNGQDSVMNFKGNYELPDYIKNIGEKIYLNPSLEKQGQNEKIDMSDRKLPFEEQHKGIQRTVTIINIPDGYELNYKPEDVSFKGSRMDFKISYQAKATQVIQTTDIEVDFLILSLSEIPEWNKMVDAMDNAYKENIVFKKK